jgi:alpha-N-arabinofuranosidase
VQWKRSTWGLLVCLVGLAPAGVLSNAARAADTPELTVHADRPSHRISPMLYGLMTEEINHSYDGGLYGELISNRTFGDTKIPAPPRRRSGDPPVPMTTQPTTVPAQPLHWSLVTSGGAAGEMNVDTENPVNAAALTHSLRMDIKSVGAGGRVGVANDGFWGIPVKPSTTYRASFYARGTPSFAGPLIGGIESGEDGAVVASASIAKLSAEWKRYEVALKTVSDVAPSTNNRFVISASSPGTVWLNLVSLFPPTFHDRPNGNRVDLMQLMEGMRPAFLRFPGGNYLEGDYFNERFNWKQTLGPVEQRPGHNSPWRYRSSDGLGLLEFLLWCEDLKMEPVLAVFAGYTLRGQHVVGPELQPYIDEALEEIEYVTGGPETKWGQQRANDGHPEPFKLPYVEIGNEDEFDRNDGGTYDARFAQFYDAIKAKYPKLQLIATAKVRSRTPDVIDDHYYRPAVAMQRDVHHYDHTDRAGTKIFVGEWASRENPPDRTLTPTLHAALGDAAWMTGLERNSDVVVMSCYAPLLTNVNRGAWQWETDLIGYDALGSFGSPSYHIQAMFAQSRGDVVLPVDLTNAMDIPPQATPPATQPARGPATSALPPKTTAPVSGAAANPPPQQPSESLFATASREDASGDLIVKFVNTRENPQEVRVSIKGISNVAGAMGLTVTGDPKDMNSVQEPTKIAPRPLPLTASSGEFSVTFPAHSASVLRLKTR